MERTIKSYFSYYFCHFFSHSFCLSKEEKGKIKQKYNASIYERIRPSWKSEYFSDIGQRFWNQSEEKESSTDTNKDDKMERIKALPFGDIKRYQEYDNSWYYEK